MSAWLRIVVAGAILAACGEDDSNLPGVTVTFLDADAQGRLPLDAIDGFPFRVKVKAHIAQLRGGIKAQVLVNGGPSGASPFDPAALIREATVALGPDATDEYSAVVALNALGPGVVSVQAHVAGESASASATIPPPSIAANISLTEIWSGAAPRYGVCVETSAVKGTVTLSAEDPVVLAGQAALTGTLLPGPCEAPEVPAGPGTSHASFTLAYPPPFDLIATLAGRPTTADAAAWSTRLVVNPELIPTIALSLTDQATGTRSAVGSLFAVTATATSSDRPVAGLNLSFASLAPNVAITPTTASTDARGRAVAYVLVPYDSVVPIQVIGGGAFAATAIGGEPNPLAIALTATAATMLDGATLYRLDAKATSDTAPVGGATVSFSLLATTGDGAPPLVPAVTITDPQGHASSWVVVPHGTRIVVEAVLGGVNVGATVVINE